MIEKAIFQHSQAGFHTANFDRQLAEAVTDQAQHWINSLHGKISVVDISVSIGKSSSIAVVWFTRVK